ncbi:hypothetical protein LTR91_005953 [Friedmanniomyces endolithicus]|uniref:Choline monooxygenase, chloroplastic n=1 Tax=Friedmanniomyces endolithicus TaxID=329885 RepID=A0AAN6QX12_9PEZI|nr:hypothetical protein LTR94_006719 [Friedmanniomyces endolithicus]KAK0808718.1 hypothetical protein LTR59_002871 [Friedmanniomyces endolithicus]KAK0813049.1 hypothetical protein LTR38_003124 [Friedmanniomyces endolithicus]KAK0844084.1 hypothetical protein LTR03_008267 [Friedmanniomyces endolithicus]KAK0870314.1 hypothetical protein LTS02_002580 [Friedmanniomyces endolithicus]
MATNPPRTLPASWYTSRPLYQLECRAVFLKSWYLLGPIIKFLPGTFVDYEFAGIYLTVTATPCMDPNDQRHNSSITVLDSTTGTPLRHHTTSTGLLSTTISPLAPSFHTFFPGLEGTLSTVDFTVRPHRRSIAYEGHINWKTMIDGYQECLHCQYTHPAFSLLYPPTFYAVKNHHNWCQHYADAARPDDGLFLYFLPNCTLKVYGGGMSLFRVCPTEDPGRTRMEFDYYNVVEGEEFEEYYKFVRQVADEDFELCETVQGNLERGVYAEGVLNSVKENGVAYYQQRVLEMVLEQHQEDRQQARTREAEEAAASTSAVEHAPGRHGNSIPNRAIVEASA